MSGGALASLAWPVKLSADMEQASVAMEVFLGSASAARQMISSIELMAARTPFRFDELKDAANLLLGFGAQAIRLFQCSSAGRCEPRQLRIIRSIVTGIRSDNGQGPIDGTRSLANDRAGIQSTVLVIKSDWQISRRPQQRDGGWSIVVFAALCRRFKLRLHPD